MSEIAPKKIITYINPVFPVGANPPRTDAAGVGVTVGPGAGILVGPGTGVFVGPGVFVSVGAVVTVGVGVIPQFSIPYTLVAKLL